MLNIRLQLIRESSPLGNCDVKVGGNDFITNGDGIVDLQLVEGQHQIALWVGENMLKRKIVVDTSKSHIIVDVTPRPTLEIVVERLLGERYKLKSILGRGGMGVVFKAEDRVLNRLVAIKMLSGELEGNLEAQRVFLEEGRSLAPLVHPNLVAIHDILNVDSHTLMVLEFISGDNLDSLLKKGALDEKTALRYVLQMTRAIAFMHSRGFIHRDVKPGNAVVQSDGTVKMIDFGLARSLEEMDQKGTSVRGTPAYMSPEQITGKAMTPKVDIYQLGVTLYELLTGELPFSGEQMYAHVHTQPTLLSDKNTEISLEMSNIVARCLMKDPILRPTADELMSQFQNLYLHGDDIDDDEINALLYNRITSHSVTGHVTREVAVVVREPITASAKNRWILILGLLGFVIALGVVWIIAGSTREATASDPAVAATKKEQIIEPAEIKKVIPPIEVEELVKVVPVEKPVEVVPEPIVKEVVAPVEKPVVNAPIIAKPPRRKVRKKVKAAVVKAVEPVEKVDPPKKVVKKPIKKSKDNDILIDRKKPTDNIMLDRPKSKSDDILLK